MNHVAEQALKRIQSIAAAVAPADPLYTDLSRRVSLARILLRSAEMHPFTGADEEYLQESARRAGKIYDRYCPIIGWEMFTRADTVGAGSGGYLTGTDTPTAADALRPRTLTIPLGATVIDTKNNFSLPRQTAIATASWLPTETTVQSEADASFSTVAFAPHTCAAYCESSR